MSRLVFWKNRAQLFFVCLPIVYVAVMAAVAESRSSDRRSVVRMLDETEAVDATLGALTESDQSKLQLQNFHRVAVKDGRPVWEVNARDAKYYPLESTVHVNEVALKVFRGDKPPVALTANVAKLYLSGNALRRASFEGNILVGATDLFAMKTELADYDDTQKVVTAPGAVLIQGTGFEVTGVGLRYATEADMLELLSDVRCRFEEGAKVPKNLPGAHDAKTK